MFVKCSLMVYFQAKFKEKLNKFYSEESFIQLFDWRNILLGPSETTVSLAFTCVLWFGTKDLAEVISVEHL